MRVEFLLKTDSGYAKDKEKTRFCFKDLCVRALIWGRGECNGGRCGLLD